MPRSRFQFTIRHYGIAIVVLAFGFSSLRLISEGYISGPIELLFYVIFGAGILFLYAVGLLSFLVSPILLLRWIVLAVKGDDRRAWLSRWNLEPRGPVRFYLARLALLAIFWVSTLQALRMGADRWGMAAFHWEEARRLQGQAEHWEEAWQLYEVDQHSPPELIQERLALCQEAARGYCWLAQTHTFYFWNCCFPLITTRLHPDPSFSIDPISQQRYGQNRLDDRLNARQLQIEQAWKARLEASAKSRGPVDFEGVSPEAKALDVTHDSGIPAPTQVPTR